MIVNTKPKIQTIDYRMKKKNVLILMTWDKTNVFQKKYSNTFIILKRNMMSI